MASSTPKKVAIILSSTRPIRVGPAVVELVQDVLKSSPSYSTVEVTVVDVAEFNLPLFNEKVVPAAVPAYAQFEHEHSKIWSAAIAPYDGYIWVTAEYNFGAPAATKNAIDYLYNEWKGKPIYIIGYGINGGRSAATGLKQTFEGMKLRVVPTRPALTFVGGGFGAETQAAISTGKLGEETTKAFKAEADINKGFEELVELLNDPEKKGSEVDFKPGEF